MPNHRPDEPIAPATIPGQPLDPKIPPEQQADNEDPGERPEDGDVSTDERGNEMLSATSHGMPSGESSDRGLAAEVGSGGPKVLPQIPDRSAEPAVQESLDSEKSATAASTDDVEREAQPEARDDEGNVTKAPAKEGATARPARPDSDAGSQ